MTGSPEILAVAAPGPGTRRPFRQPLQARRCARPHVVAMCQERALNNPRYTPARGAPCQTALPFHPISCVSNVPPHLVDNTYRSIVHASSARSARAIRRSLVSNPSVNQPYTPASVDTASSRLPCVRHNRLKLIAARSS